MNNFNLLKKIDLSETRFHDISCMQGCVLETSQNLSNQIYFGSHSSWEQLSCPGILNYLQNNLCASDAGYSSVWKVWLKNDLTK